jgi:hypothetical protein
MQDGHLPMMTTLTSFRGHSLDHEYISFATISVTTQLSWHPDGLTWRKDLFRLLLFRNKRLQLLYQLPPPYADIDPKGDSTYRDKVRFCQFILKGQ